MNNINSNFDVTVSKNIPFITFCFFNPRHYFILLSKRFYSLWNLQTVFNGWTFVVSKSLSRVECCASNVGRENIALKTIAISLNRRGVEDINNHSGIYSITRERCHQGSNHHLAVQLVPKQSFAHPTTPTRPWIKHSLQAFQTKPDNDYICTREKIEAKLEKICFNWSHF